VSVVQDVDNDVKHLTALLTEKRQEIEGLSSAWKTEGKGIVLSPEQHRKYLAAVGEANTLMDRIKGLKSIQGIDAYLNAPAGQSAAGADAAASHARPQTKSLGQSLVESEDYLEAKGRDWKNPYMNVRLDGGIDAAAMSGKDIFTAMGGTVTFPALGQVQDLGLTERVLRPGRVRDLFPAAPTQASVLWGMRETGFTNNARVVPERTAADGTAATGGPTDVYGLKPKSDLTIVPIMYPIATIAHIMYVHRNTLADVPRLRDLIDRDMIDGVKMAEDQQLLYGDGSGDNLTGLVNTEGIQSYTGLATDKRSTQVRRAATRALLAYFQPTGVVLHPLDWEAIEVETDKNGAYTVAVSVAIGAEKRLWRLNVVDSPAMQQGRFLVGAFGTGAKVYDREAVGIEVSTENRDMFERNAVTLRCEERVGLVVDRPESFVYGSITTPA
jgi:hypothetical protein